MPSGSTVQSSAERALRADARDWDSDETWHARARCRGADVNVFFSPSHFEKKDERLAREAQAKAVCELCEVRRECREFALATREPYGIWGGLSESERRALITRRAG